MEIFSSREIATAFWFVSLLLISLKSDEAAKSQIAVLASFKNLKIIFMLEALAVYLMLVCLILSKLMNWGLDELKSAIMWFFFVGTVLLYKSVMQDENYNPVKSWAKNTFTLVIFIEFLATKYTFHFLVELFFVPFLALVAIMSVVADRNEKTKNVANLCQSILALVGLYMLAYGVWEFSTDTKTLENWNFLQEFSLPILLSFFTIPFFYGLHAVVTYENVFIRLKWSLSDDTLRKQTKRKAISRFGLHLGALKRWARLMQGERPANLEEVDALITETHEQHNLSKSPPEVNPKDGWSPYIAKDFLSSKSVQTSDYRESMGEWYAESHIQKPGRRFSQNFMVYYIEGTQTVAKQLRLKLTLNVFEERDKHLDWIKTFAAELLRHALPNSEISLSKFFNSDNNETIVSGKRVSLSKKTIEVGNLIIEEYEFRIKVIEA